MGHGTYIGIESTRSSHVIRPVAVLSEILSALEKAVLPCSWKVRPTVLRRRYSGASKNLEDVVPDSSTSK